MCVCGPHRGHGGGEGDLYRLCLSLAGEDLYTSRRPALKVTTGTSGRERGEGMGERDGWKEPYLLTSLSERKRMLNFPLTSPPDEFRRRKS